MKQINTYINEKLRLSAKPQYTCQPKNNDELKQIIIDRIKNEGNECDLNDIDVSKITDMTGLFDADDNGIFEDFNGDVSQWNVSNVTDMHFMFCCCEKFNCDLSRWNVSNVKNMKLMFCRCKQFNQDLSNWDVSNVNTMRSMFYGCENFDYDLSMWNVKNVKHIDNIFRECKKFNCDLSMWDVSNVETMDYAFYNCPTQPTWYDKR
jgi:surface protein